jgi:hypothetical protein
MLGRISSTGALHLGMKWMSPWKIVPEESSESKRKLQQP